jgi:hypothetical protein
MVIIQMHARSLSEKKDNKHNKNRMHDISSLLQNDNYTRVKINFDVAIGTDKQGRT